MKRPLNLRVESRLNALAQYAILDTPPEAEFDDLARLVRNVCDTPISQISFLDDRRCWHKASIGTKAAESALEQSFCRHAMLRRSLFVVENALRDPRFRRNAAVAGAPHVRFYAGAPLITSSGTPIGVISAIDLRPRTLTHRQSEALASLARQTMARLELRRLERKERSRPISPAVMGRCRRSRELLGKIAEIISAGADAETVLRAAVRAVCEATGAAIGHVWIPDPRWNAQGLPLHVEHPLTPPLARPTIDQKSAPLLRDIELASTTIPSAYCQVAAMIVPLPGRELPGLLGLYHAQPIALGPDLRSALKQVCTLLGQSMDRLHSQSALRLSETYFRHLVEDALDLIIVLDREGMIQFESRSIWEQLGWSSSELRGKSAFALVHPDDCAAVMAALEESMRNEGPTPILCFKLRHRDSTYRMLEGRGNNLLTDPAVRGIVLSSRNITERKQLEDQFGQLAGGIAHDFNNLLSVIVGYSSKAEAHPEADAELRMAVRQIQRASERAAGLTGQLLACTGRQVLQPRVFSLNNLLAECEAAFKALLGGGIRLRIHNDGVEIGVYADAGQVELVLRNLLLNSREAISRRGEVSIQLSAVTIATKAQSASEGLPVGDFCLVEVYDDGCGMTPEVSARVFEPYFTTKGLGEGSGLGLATCQGILRQSGGKITVRSVFGHGAVFGIYLPMAELASPETHIQPPATMIARGGRPNVLFADDEEGLRELGASMLREMGCRALVADNGRVALDLLDSEPGLRLDLLLTDIVMPEMDGKQLADEILRRRPGTPVLFCSGYSHDQSFYRGLPKGSTFLAKPYSTAILAQCVCRLLQEGGAAVRAPG